ncbi:MAG TPA: O-antigen ligase family protein [Miltoncostaeaceae bacterium]|nr:O-antigen ligase family protein [Miltoncostaeaceae bacterium]
MNETARNVAAIAAAVGVAGLLLPVAALRAEYQRAASAALLLGAWGWLLAGLVPSGDAKDAAGRFDSPVRIVALMVAAAAAILLAAWLVRTIIRTPTVWFVLLGVALPIRTPVTIGSQEANLLVPLYAVILLGLIAWVWGRVRGHVDAPALEGPWVLTVPLAAFTAYVLVSTLWSADSSEAAIKASCFFIPFVLLYAVVVAWWSRARALAALAVTTVAGGVIAALVALYQYATSDIWWNATLQQANVYSRFFRVNGIFFDPNILGRYLAIGILVCLALAWVRRARIELIVLTTAVVLMTAGLAVTFSRSSALMLMLGVALLAGGAIGAGRAALTGRALLLVAGGLAAATSSNVRHALTDQNRLERVSEGRFDLMKGGLEIWRDDPVVGAGLGGFERRFEETLTPTEQRRVRVVISHNSPITVLSEEGVVGFALFALLLVGAGWATVRGSKGQGDIGWARWTIGAILAGIAVHSLLYAALFEDPFLWAGLGAAVALAALAPAPHAPPPREPAAEEATATL